MAGIEARQQGALNPEVEVRRRADDESVVLTATHRKGDKRDGLYDDEGSAAGGKRSCVLMHFVMYSTHLCSVSGQKVFCPQEQVHLVEYGTTRGNCAAGKSNPNCCI